MMAELHVIGALREKRSELGGVVKQLEQRLAQHRAALVHLDATMRLFDPDIQPQEIRPRQQRARGAWFRPGECLRLIYDELRDASQPVTTRELATRIMRTKDMPTDDDRHRELIQKTVLVAVHRPADDAMHLLAVADAAEILAPGRFLGVAHEIRPGNVVVMAEFAPAQAAEVGFSAVGAGIVDAVAVLVVDPPHREPGVQPVPGRALIGMNSGALGDAMVDRRHGVGFGGKHLRQGPAATLAHRHDNLALAGLVLGEPPIDPVDGQVRGADMTAEIGAMNRPGFVGGSNS